MDRRARVSFCCMSGNDVQLGHRAGSSALGAEGTKLDFKDQGQPQSPSHFTLILRDVKIGTSGISATWPAMSLPIFCPVI